MKNIKKRGVRCTVLTVLERRDASYHSSVSHSHGRSYFKTRDGKVPTKENKMPVNMQDFNWYGVLSRCFFPAMSHVQAINKFKKSPIKPIPLEVLHITVYSPSV